MKYNIITETIQQLKSRYNQIERDIERIQHIIPDLKERLSHD